MTITLDAVKWRGGDLYMNQTLSTLLTTAAAIPVGAYLFASILGITYYLHLQSTDKLCNTFWN